MCRCLLLAIVLPVMVVEGISYANVAQKRLPWPHPIRLQCRHLLRINFLCSVVNSVFGFLDCILDLVFQKPCTVPGTG